MKSCITHCGCEFYGAASPPLLCKLETIQNSALRIALGAFKSSPISAIQAESSLPSLSHRRSSLHVRTYTKLASSPNCHALHTFLLHQGREPLHGPLPYQAHTPFVDRALSFFATLRFIPPSFLTQEKTSHVGLWFPLSSLVTVSLPTQWSKGACPARGRTIFNTFIHTQYNNTFNIYTDGSRIPFPPSVGAAVYIPSKSLATAWRLPDTASILTAELFAIREGLTFATTLPPCAVTLFSDSLSALQLLSRHRPHTHHSLVFSIHLLLLRLLSSGFSPHLQWVPSHIGVVGNTVADKAAAEAHSHPSPITLQTDQTDLLTLLKTAYIQHWDRLLTDSLQNTTLRRYRQDTRPHWWTHSPSRALDTAVTRLRIGHTRLNHHLYRLRLAPDPFCPWCPNQLDTAEHLLLHCPRHHSHRTVLLQSLTALHIPRPTLSDLLGGSQDPGLAFKTLKNTRTFLKKTGQLQRI